MHSFPASAGRSPPPTKTLIQKSSDVTLEDMKREFFCILASDIQTVNNRALRLPGINIEYTVHCSSYDYG